MVNKYSAIEGLHQGEPVMNDDLNDALGPAWRVLLVRRCWLRSFGQSLARESALAAAIRKPAGVITLTPIGS